MKRKRHKHLGRNIILGLLMTVMLLIVVGWGTLSIMTYHASEPARESWNASTVQQDSQWTYFPANGESKGTVVFYGGALVDLASYSKMAEGLAENGIGTYLIHSPLNLPILSQGAAVKLVTEKQLTNVYLAGHSLGGVVAAMDAKQLEANGQLGGIIFLASYPSSNTDLTTSQARVLSITGTEDKILKWDVYEAAKGNLPEQTKYVGIQGGNHSGFGLYGQQRGDGDATISAALQQEEVVRLMTAFISQ